MEIQTMHQFHRRRIRPDELFLASSFRALEKERKSGNIVVAPTYSGPISSSTEIPLVSDADIVRVPRYSLNEVASVCSMLVSRKMVDSFPPDLSIRRALALTNGNGKEVRERCVTLFQEDNGIPISLGYKVQRAETNDIII